MKKVLKTAGWLLLIALVVIQFFPPAKNVQAGVPASHIETKFSVPDDVNVILKKACYDCHSNNTVYPWYFNIQPVGMWMNHHIEEGKEHLNFSEYTDKRLRVQYHRLEEVIEQVKEGEMPLNSYTWIHKDAILSEAEKTKLMDWAQSVINTMESMYPMDSLKRKQPGQ